MFAHAQAPIRIGIAGGGTDLPVWTKDRVGFCLNLAIKTYTHAVAIRRPDKLVVASYSQRDVASAATEIANGLIRESMLMHGFEDGVEVHILSEMSSRGSGLGVSSSIAVSLAACFSYLRRMDRPAGTYAPFPLDKLSCAQLDGFVRTEQELSARDAWTVEIGRLHRPIGRQDHMAAAHGGLRLYRFEEDEAKIERTFSDDDAKWVAKHLLLAELHEGHDTRSILSGVKSIGNLQMAYDAVGVAVSAIESRDIGLLGHALKMGQLSKQGIHGAVPSWLKSQIERIEQFSMLKGCKVAGAGGGGHLVMVHESPGTWQSVDELPVRVVEADLGGVRSEGGV